MGDCEVLAATILAAEWAGRDGLDSRWPVCPWCRVKKGYDHKADCPVQLALKVLRAYQVRGERVIGA